MIVALWISTALAADVPPTVCSYFRGSMKVSWCMRAAVAEAQKVCDAEVAGLGLEGNCACTNDADYVGDRCTGAAATSTPYARQESAIATPGQKRESSKPGPTKEIVVDQPPKEDTEIVIDNPSDFE